MNIPVSQICALIIELLTLTHFDENSTPTVAFESKLNSSLVNRERMLVLPTVESPINTTIMNRKIGSKYSCISNRNDHPLERLQI